MINYRLIGVIFKQDLQAAQRRAFAHLNPLLFFIFIVSLFPLGVGVSPGILPVVAPGLIWISAVLAVLLALEGLFRGDFTSGFLDKLLLSGEPVAVLVGAKVLAHWLIAGLPLVLVTPLLGLWLQLPAAAISVLMASLLLGTPVLMLMGAIGVALTLGLRNSGLLLPLLILPWFIPVLIFGAGAVNAASAGLPYAGQLAMLAALLCMSVAVAPFAIAFALRLQVAE